MRDPVRLPRACVRLFLLGLPVAALVACSADGRDGFEASGAASPTSPGPEGPGATAPGASSSSGGGASGASSSGGGSSGSSGSSANDAGNTTGDAGITPDGGPPSVPPAGPAPWDASPCGGGAIQQADVLTHFAPAATTTTFGTVWVDARKRQCQDQTGCQGWTAASAVDLHRITWAGNGFTFPAAATLAVPATGTITCTVPGPSCSLAVATMTSNVFPPEQGRPLGITPRVAGSQVQVGNWSSNPQGNYIQYTSSVVTPACLWGTMSGRAYGASGTYVETQMVVWGKF